MLLLNAQSINPSASSKSKWKVRAIKSIIHEEKAKNHSIPFIGITESWLKSYISDAQVNIPYNETLTFDDKICEAVLCKFETVKKCIAIVYRLPEASVSSFSNVLSFLTESFKKVNDDSYQFCISGDFNFPFIDWKTSIINPGGSSESTQSANHLFAFMCERFQNQYILTSTRNNNILDPFLTNDDSLVTNVNANKTRLSDDNLVDIMI